MSFADLKRSSNSSFEKLTKELAKQNTTYSDPDEGKYWKPTVDKAGNGYAVIRFIPRTNWSLVHREVVDDSRKRRSRVRI